MFKKAALLTLLAVALKISAAPAPSDPQILQFALTLEHLENAFYTGGLEKFSSADFEKAGFPGWVRGRLEQISEHEATHVALLTSALGDQAVRACEYNFESAYKDPQTFAATSMVLETVGGSAYLGAAQYLNTDHLTIAGSILAVESRHSSWLTSSVMHLQPWNGPFDAPLTPSGAYSLAAPFIKKCPKSNAALPVKTFPKLTLSKDHPSHEQRIRVDYPGSADGEKHVAWLDGLQVVYSPVGKDGRTLVPDGLMGTVYAVVVSEKGTPNDDNMLSGFAIEQFPFGSDATNA